MKASVHRRSSDFFVRRVFISAFIDVLAVPYFQYKYHKFILTDFIENSKWHDPDGIYSFELTSKFFSVEWVGLNRSQLRLNARFNAIGREFELLLHPGEQDETIHTSFSVKNTHPA